MSKHQRWMDDHFQTKPGPKILRPDPEPETDRGRRFWFFLSLLLILPPAVVGTAWYLGYMDPVIREVVVERKPIAPPPEAPHKREPDVKLVYSAQLQKDEPAAPAAPIKSITQARANELQRLMTSRVSGIDLMTRDRSKAIAKEQAAQSDITAAKDRLTYLERNRPASSNTGAVYQWNLAHADAVAAGKNATTTIAAQQKVINSFNERIAKAQAEHDAAKLELAGAVITDN